MHRRNLLSTSAPAALAVAVAACGVIPGVTSNPTTSAIIEQFVASVAAWMPFVTAIAIFAAGAVPGGAALEGVILAGCTAVENILNTISTGMTNAQALSPAQQIVSTMQGVMVNLGTLVTSMPNLSVAQQNAWIQTQSVEASVEALVTQLAGLVPKYAPRANGPTDLLHIRKVH